MTATMTASTCAARQRDPAAEARGGDDIIIKEEPSHDEGGDALGEQRTIFPVAPAADESREVARTTKTGIARLAAESALRDERNDVAYFDLPCRSVLTSTDSRYGFEFSINPYRGCEIGCTYCYARYTHGFMDLEDPIDFERKIYVKRDVGRLLARDLARRRLGGGDRRWIAIGTATDPYQPAERRTRVTREVLETLARRDGLNVSITTKSDLVLRDVDVLKELARRGELQVNVTITTIDRDLARKLEPRAPTPEMRLRAIEALAKAGIRAGVFAIPILPEITDSKRALRGLVSAAKEAGASYLTAGVLFLRPEASARFFPWLESTFPGLVPKYRRLYRTTYPPVGVSDRIRRLVSALRRQYKLPADEDGLADAHARAPPEGDAGRAGEDADSARPLVSGQLPLFRLDAS